MAGNKHAHEIAESSDLPVDFDDFLGLWSSFGINANEFLKYLLTRIEVSLFMCNKFESFFFCLFCWFCCVFF